MQFLSHQELLLLMKMKKILLVISIFFNISYSYSQVRGIAKFELKVTGERALHNRVENYVLYFDNTRSIEFTQGTNFARVSKSDNEIFETKVLKSNSKRRFIYKDFKKKKLVIRTGIDTKNYLIEDTLDNFKWRISNEKKKILKFECIKATTNFRGRDYEAWFTEDIPIQNGPWKFCGLPGFIVAIKDKSGSYSYELREIDLQAKFEPKIISLPEDFSSEKKITHKQFISLYRQKVADLAKMSRVVQKDADGSSFSRIISIPEILEKY